MARRRAAARNRLRPRLPCGRERRPSPRACFHRSWRSSPVRSPCCGPIIHTVARTGRNENGPPSGPRIEALAERAPRDGRSIGTSMQHGLVGLVQIGKVDGLVLARLEDDVAQHLATTRALAFDMDHEGGAVAL